MLDNILSARHVFVLYIIIAFLTMGADGNQDQPERYTSLDTVNGQLVSANLRLTANFYHYMVWVIVSVTLLALTVHFSNGKRDGPLNIIVMLVILISFLFGLRYLYMRFRKGDLGRFVHIIMPV